MFQINRRIEYAVRILLALGEQQTEARVSARILAKRTGVPKAYLHKIAADLVRAGLVRTYPGAAGGLTLVAPAAEVTMHHVIEALEGPIRLDPPDAATDERTHAFWLAVQDTLVTQLQSCTLAGLMTGEVPV